MVHVDPEGGLPGKNKRQILLPFKKKQLLPLNLQRFDGELLQKKWGLRGFAPFVVPLIYQERLDDANSASLWRKSATTPIAKLGTNNFSTATANATLELRSRDASAAATSSATSLFVTANSLSHKRSTISYQVTMRDQVNT